MNSTSNNNLTMEKMQAAIDLINDLPRPRLREIVITRMVPDAFMVTIKGGDTQGVMRVDTDHLLIHPATWARWLSDMDAEVQMAASFGNISGLPVYESEERAHELLSKALEQTVGGRAKMGALWDGSP